MNVRILRLVGDERICILTRSGHYNLNPGPPVSEDVAAGPPLFRRRPSLKNNVRLKFRTFEWVEESKIDPGRKAVRLTRRGTEVAARWNMVLTAEEQRSDL